MSLDLNFYLLTRIILRDDNTAIMQCFGYIDGHEVAKFEIPVRSDMGDLPDDTSVLVARAMDAVLAFRRSNRMSITLPREGDQTIRCPSTLGSRQCNEPNRHPGHHVAAKVNPKSGETHSMTWPNTNPISVIVCPECGHAASVHPRGFSHNEGPKITMRRCNGYIDPESTCNCTVRAEALEAAT